METVLAEAGEENDESAIIDLGKTGQEETQGEEDHQGNEEDSEKQEETEVTVGDSSEGDEEDPQELIARLRAENEKAKKDRDRAFYNLRNAKKTEKKESKEPEFSDAQLLDLLEQHSDDKPVMLQIIKQVAKQQSGDMADAKIKGQEIKQKKATIDNFVLQNYSTFVTDDTPEHQELQKAKAFMHIEDHPLGDYLAIAALELAGLPKTIEQVRKSAVEEALKKNGEAGRKKAVKETSMGDSKPKKKIVESDDDNSESRFLATAKQMGLNKEQTKTYLKMVKNAKKRSIIVNE